MIILIDNGHGCDTDGKYSPDGMLREFAWARQEARMLAEMLRLKGYDARRIVTEETDIPLAERVRRVNAVCRQAGAKNVVLVSIHVNAAGDGSGWMPASGWSVYVSSKNASMKSKALAKAMLRRAKEARLLGNRCVPGAGYWEGNFAMVRDTDCPAVLVENLFMDNKVDVALLQSDEGREKLAKVMADGIDDWVCGGRM